MDINKLSKQITKASKDRTRLIDALLVELEGTVAKGQKALLQSFIDEWVDTLDVDQTTGKIKNTLRNKRLLANVDKVFNQYVATNGLEIAKTMVEGVKTIIDFNGKYYQAFASKTELAPIRTETVEFMKSWLGLKGNGALEGNGYLQKTISDVKILGELKNLALRAVVGQQGYTETKKAVTDFIAGNKKEAGMLERYSRNFVYDTYSQVDRATAGTFANKLKLNYAIYEGGVIKTSRKFCKERNGQVFTREEVAAFDPKEAKPPNYNPFNDLGGFGCRHHLNWVSYDIALLYRSDLPEPK